MVTLIGWYMVVLFGLNLIAMVTRGIDSGADALAFVLGSTGFASGLYLLLAL